jgi:tyrosinase
MWVNGFMATFRSSFDPIFWCHHANVDRQFWLWQQKYGDSSIPDAVRNFTCRPFRFKDNRAEAFFDTRELGYTYANARLSVPRAEAVLKAKGGDTEAPLPATLTVALGDIRGDVQRARLYLHGLHHTEASYEIRVFANRKSADAETPATPRSNYLGSFFLLGHGNCPGAPGHCAVRVNPEFSGDVRAPHHLAPYDPFIDVTAGVRKLVAAKKGAPLGELRLSFVVVDAAGDQVPSQKIEFENITITTD